MLKIASCHHMCILLASRSNLNLEVGRKIHQDLKHKSKLYSSEHETYKCKEGEKKCWILLEDIIVNNVIRENHGIQCYTMINKDELITSSGMS